VIPPNTAATNPIRADGEQLIGGAPADWVQALMANAPVDPASVAQLVALGFPETSVRRALALSQGNIDLAASFLLENR
jgi:hypothetical protein